MDTRLARIYKQAQDLYSPSHQFHQFHHPLGSLVTMKISTLVIMAGSALAAAKQSTFGIMSLRSASPIHFGQVSAAQSNLFIHLPDQHAVCKGPEQSAATFYIKDGELFLYTPSGKPAQKMFVDRSGMGQGKLGYVTGNAGLPRYAETKGWKITDQYLSFNGAGLIACPSIDDAWNIWVDVGIANPGYSEGCLGFSARTVPISKPVKCTYT
ncbi:hypothetical protein B0I35DRAFT_415700 [Stachybotrys elegans]|uniref:Cell wall protein PhiA n=1 Tax=Stachybotrys elegans TaxID=80388 RepID=A0A8K0SX74_9HYPO|nr:hypothetical protein B0I35DRAFT_415700 [Stachybotrys elegans]